MKTVVKIALSVSAAYLLDVFVRDRLAGLRARKLALASGKPMIVVGSGTETSSATGAKLWGRDIPGSVHCDKAAVAGALCSPHSVCYCDSEDLAQFKDKQFSVALASNFLRYVPNRAKAERELARVADIVIVSDHIIPWPQIGAGSRWALNGLDK